MNIIPISISMECSYILRTISLDFTHERFLFRIGFIYRIVRTHEIEMGFHGLEAEATQSYVQYSFNCPSEKLDW